MPPSQRLAFVDLETSGLSPRADRITEIGVITVDDDAIEEWTTLVNPGTRIAERSRRFNGITPAAVADAPRFADIASALAARLAGRLFIAHNARFDCGFLRAGFERVGIEFQPPVVCSLMLSRKLYPALAGHDLDTLMQRHGLYAEVRHRALPDARLVWQFWQLMRAGHPPAQLAAVIATLLAGPVLPPHLDPSLIDRLPEAPGVYVLHGEDNTVLHVGKASNLKLHLINYFRLDRMSGKALVMSHRITNITWRMTRGAIGTHLQFTALAGALAPARHQRTARAVCSWRLLPARYPCVELVELAGRCGDGEAYGIYASERKARNALLRLATRAHLCHALLGIRAPATDACTGCELNGMSACGAKRARLAHFTKAVVALRALRVAPWPYDGPVGIRERADLHIVDDWRYVGTAQSEHEIHQVLETRRAEFDEDTFAFLARTLARLPRKRIVHLSHHLATHAGPDPVIAQD
ncbi:MAG: exonuclease domain-containing protein [Burkholderiales bacterium]